MPYCIGLTGGIGSGKSTAASLFETLGASVVDTDAIAHELTRPGGRAIAAIRDAFGAAAIAPDGGLDRARMRERVFRDPAEKRRLEAILHPMIRAAAREAAAAARGPYVLLVVPLLFETGACLDVTRRVVVVDCSEARQIERASRRSGLSPDAVRAIMAAQLPREVRRARADDVLDNEGDLASLRRQVDALHAKYLALAGAADPGRVQ